MAGKRPDYEVFVSKQNGDSNFYTKIGAAWKVAKDGISIKLDLLPLDGKIVLFPPKEDNSR